MAKAVWSVVLMALASQVMALLVWGHSAYLWVQGIEGLTAAVPLLALGIRYVRNDTRKTRWPPLLPVAGIAASGGIKDLCVAIGAETPTLIVVLLLAAVAWFLCASWIIWRRESPST